MKRRVGLGWTGLVAVCAGLLVAGNAWAQSGGDLVKFKDGSQWIQVKVTKETYKAVEVEGKEESPHPDKIQSIKHGDTPPAYLAGEQSLRLGQYERAIAKFEEAGKASARPWLKHYCSYYTALCKQKMAEGGKPDALIAAAGDYAKVIKDTPDGILVPDAKLGLAQCYHEAKQLDKAVAAFGEIAKSDYGPLWQQKGTLWLGKILLEQGKGADAAKVFEEVMKTTAGKETMEDVYYEAALSRAASLIVATPPQCEEARKLLTKLLDEADSDEVKAAAHNGMGDAYRAEKRIQEARLEYLRVVVLYFDAAEEHARALFYAADCFQQLKEAGEARRFQNLLRQQHPDSVWKKRLGG